MESIKQLYIKIMLIIIVGFGSYLVFAYWPLLKFRLRNNDLTFETLGTDNAQDYIRQNSIHLRPIPKDNILLIPKIGVKANILEGQDLKILDNYEGVLREPRSNSPEQMGNMVIAGHRRQFLPPNTATFYLLPELKINDDIIIFWNEKQYVYKVINSFETTPDDQFTYERSTTNLITLYTCSPLGTASRRWVVRAQIVDTS